MDHSKMLSKLIAASTALLTTVVLFGLDDGQLGGWFRAMGGGAAVGFAIAVFAEARRGEAEDLCAIANRFGPGAVGLVAVCAAIAGTINFVVRRHGAAAAEAARARADVSRYVAGQGFWAGQPVILDRAVQSFGAALLEGRGPALRRGRLRASGVTHAVTRGPASGSRPLAVTGLVCSRYFLVPNHLTRSFGFRFAYRLVSPGGVDEAHVVSGGSATVTARGRTLRVAGLVAAAGPRRDNRTQNTIFIMGLSAPRAVAVRPPSYSAVRRLCGLTGW